MYAPPFHSPSTGNVPPPCGISDDESKSFLSTDGSAGARTLLVSNLDSRVTRKILYELMIQVGPVEAIKIYPTTDGASKPSAFVRFVHAVSCRYAVLILDGLVLFHSSISVMYPGVCDGSVKSQHPPYATTFFEIPRGLDKVWKENQLVAALAIPRLDCLSGHSVKAPVKKQLENSVPRSSSSVECRRGLQDPGLFGDSLFIPVVQNSFHLENIDISCQLNPVRRFHCNKYRTGKSQHAHYQTSSFEFGKKIAHRATAVCYRSVPKRVFDGKVSECRFQNGISFSRYDLMRISCTWKHVASSRRISTAVSHSVGTMQHISASCDAFKKLAIQERKLALH